MRLVESVSGELEDQVVQIIGLLLVQPLLVGAVDEDDALGLDHLFLLLADGLDQRVGITKRQVAQTVQDLHDLFLIDHDSIRRG